MAVKTKGRKIEKSEEGLWQECVSRFKALVGPEELILYCKQGEIVAEIWERWKGAGLNQLSLETGLSSRRIQEVWRLYQTFLPKNWDEELPCRFHIIIAWNYQLAVMRDIGFEQGYTPEDWLVKAGQNKWNEDILEQRIEVYYGIFDFKDLSIVEELLKEKSDWEIHPITKRALEDYLKRYKKDEEVLPSGLHLFVVTSSWEIIVADKEKALEEVRKLMKQGDFSKARFSVREKK